MSCNVITKLMIMSQIFWVVTLVVIDNVELLACFRVCRTLLCLTTAAVQRVARGHQYFGVACLDVASGEAVALH